MKGPYVLKIAQQIKRLPTLSLNVVNTTNIHKEKYVMDGGK